MTRTDRFWRTKSFKSTQSLCKSMWGLNLLIHFFIKKHHNLVGDIGLEPILSEENKILSLACLRIPPIPQNIYLIHIKLFLQYHHQNNTSYLFRLIYILESYNQIYLLICIVFLPITYKINVKSNLKKW